MNINYYLSFRNGFAAINQGQILRKGFSKTDLIINQSSMKTYGCPFFPKIVQQITIGHVFKD